MYQATRALESSGLDGNVACVTLSGCEGGAGRNKNMMKKTNGLALKKKEPTVGGAMNNSEENETRTREVLKRDCCMK